MQNNRNGTSIPPDFIEIKLESAAENQAPHSTALSQTAQEVNAIYKKIPAHLQRNFPYSEIFTEAYQRKNEIIRDTENYRINLRGCRSEPMAVMEEGGFNPHATDIRVSSLRLRSTKPDSLFLNVNEINLFMEGGELKFVVKSILGDINLFEPEKYKKKDKLKEATISHLKKLMAQVPLPTSLYILDNSPDEKTKQALKDLFEFSESHIPVATKPLNVCLTPKIINNPDDIEDLSSPFIIAKDGEGKLCFFCKYKESNIDEVQTRKIEMDHDFVAQLKSLVALTEDTEYESENKCFLDSLEKLLNNQNISRDENLRLCENQLPWVKFFALISAKGGTEGHHLNIYMHRDGVKTEGRLTGSVSCTTSMNVAKNFAGGNGFIYTVVVAGGVHAASTSSKSNPQPLEREVTVPGGIDWENIIAFRKLPTTPTRGNPFDVQDSIFIRASFLKANPTLLDSIVAPYLEVNEKILTKDVKHYLETTSNSSLSSPNTSPLNVKPSSTTASVIQQIPGLITDLKAQQQTSLRISDNPSAPNPAPSPSISSSLLSTSMDPIDTVKELLLKATVSIKNDSIDKSEGKICITFSNTEEFKQALKELHSSGFSTQTDYAIEESNNALLLKKGRITATPGDQDIRIDGISIKNQASSALRH